ncbi:predicted protein [Plenodomus lingam JN3]|uniref:Predicted protein n=1 Tax=Leptosphaeria maculans (strain JN3 / isolate v23.1.3 / race Av1-4-5-6-7-8) TaxID=985895 RepID=E4ZNA8_LEPMJ|nr:predicted protein [Plenodomus lingam JN3]CBX92967.1 predicted protein [Plenodomus lingam JN3]
MGARSLIPAPSFPSTPFDQNFTNTFTTWLGTIGRQRPPATPAGRFAAEGVDSV